MRREQKKQYLAESWERENPGKAPLAQFEDENYINAYGNNVIETVEKTFDLNLTKNPYLKKL
ncbi:MAG: hypothetical protein WCR02_10515 [Sphaerochaetaceae bacterium]